MSTYLGLDYGERRIGVACSDELHRFSEPLKILDAKSPQLLSELSDLISEFNVCELVVGIPKRTGGEIKSEAERVLRFVHSLKKKISCPIVTWDERFTTKIADQILDEANIKQENRKGKRDAVAAAVMLQGYLDFKRLGNQHV